MLACYSVTINGPDHLTHFIMYPYVTAFYLLPLSPLEPIVKQLDCGGSTLLQLGVYKSRKLVFVPRRIPRYKQIR